MASDKEFPWETLRALRVLRSFKKPSGDRVFIGDLINDSIDEAYFRRFPPAFALLPHERILTP